MSYLGKTSSTAFGTPVTAIYTHGALLISLFCACCPSHSIPHIDTHTSAHTRTQFLGCARSRIACSTLLYHHWPFSQLIVPGSEESSSKASVASSPKMLVTAMAQTAWGYAERVGCVCVCACNNTLSPISALEFCDFIPFFQLQPQYDVETVFKKNTDGKTFSSAKNDDLMF